MPEAKRKNPRVYVEFHNVNRVTGEVEESRTKQEMSAACDINNIMKKFEKTGSIDHMTLKPPQYGDFSSTMSFQDARNSVLEATASFKQLPHAIRTYFGNDPSNLVDFMADPDNLEKGRELGLYAPAEAPAEPPAPVRVEVVLPQDGAPVIAGGETDT